MIMANGFTYFTANAQVSKNEIETTISSLVEFTAHPLSEEDIQNLDSEYHGALIASFPIQFNFNALKQIPLENGGVYTVKTDTLSGQLFNLPLPDRDEVLTLQIESAQKLISESDITTYTGYIKENPHSRFVFSVNGEVINGQIAYGGVVYKLHRLNNRELTPVMSVINPRLMPRGIEDNVDSKEKSPVIPLYKSGSSGGNVRILFLYASNVVDPLPKISALIADHNDIMHISGVTNNRYISYAGSQVVYATFSDPGVCKSSIIARMRDNIYEFVGLNSQMQAARADYAFLIVNGAAGPSACAVGFPGLSGHIGGQVAGFLESNKAYGMSADNYLGYAADHTGVHEIGHLLGGFHPGEGTTIDEGILYDNPYPVEKWQSMMGSYQTYAEGDCNFVAPTDDSCLRIPRFSNPNRNYWVTGDPLGSVDSDMVTYLDYSVPIAGDFEPNPDPQPSAPTGFNVVSDQCYGFNLISWNSVSGAYNYKLYRSYFAGFPDPDLIYDGSNNVTNINVSSGTEYLRVRACNDAGCSSYSIQQPASRVGYCL